MMIDTLDISMAVTRLIHTTVTKDCANDDGDGLNISIGKN